MLIAIEFQRLRQTFLESYPIGYGESVMSAAAQRFAQGGALYQPVEQAPHHVLTYPPLYHSLIGLVGDPAAPWFAARTVSALSLLVIVAAVAILVREMAISAVPSLERSSVLTIAATSGCVAAVQYPNGFVALVGLVDPFALAAQLMGFALFAVCWRRGWALYWCIPPLLIAAFTKQSYVFGAAAIWAPALIADWRRTLPAAVVWGGSGLSALIGLNLLTDGLAVEHMFAVGNTGTGNPVYQHLVNNLLHPMTLGMAALLGITGVILGTGQWWRTQRSSPILLVPLLYLAVGWMWVEGSRIHGSHINYALEWVAACSLGIGLCLLFAAKRSPVAFACVTMFLGFTQMRFPPVDATLEGRLSDSEAWDNVVEVVANAEGDVISYDAGVVLAAGKTPVIVDSWMFVLLRRKDTKIGAEIVDRVRAKDFSYIILREDDTSPFDDPESRAAVVDNYALDQCFSQLCVWSPR